MGNSRGFGRQREKWAKCSDCGGMHPISRMMSDEDVNQLAMVCLMHFGHSDYEKYSCETCADFKPEICSGKKLRGSECVGNCMAEKASFTEFGSSGF